MLLKSAVVMVWSTKSDGLREHSLHSQGSISRQGIYSYVQAWAKQVFEKMEFVYVEKSKLFVGNRDEPAD